MAAASASAAAGRRIQTAVLGASTAAAQCIRTTVLGSSAAAGSCSHMSKDLLRGLPQKEIRMAFGLPRPTYLRLQERHMCSSSDKDGIVDAGSLKDLESRISTLEVVCKFYEKFTWVVLGPICLGLVAIPSAIYTIHGVYTVREMQKNTAEEVADLKRRIEYLEGSTK